MKVHQPAQPAQPAHRLLEGEPQYRGPRKIVVRGLEQGQRPVHRCNIPPRDHVIGIVSRAGGGVRLLAAWPPGRLAAWPPGRLAAWPPGRLAAWPPGTAVSS